MSTHTASRGPGPALAAGDPCWCGSGRRYRRCHRKSDADPAGAAAAAARAVVLGRSGRRIRPGQRSPWRDVPAEIARPPYDATGGVPSGDRALRPRTAHEVERMRVAGRLAAEVLALAGDAAVAGATTDDVDAVVHAACLERGAYPSPLGYRGAGDVRFPGSCCTSLNEVVCHGVPDSTELLDGDLLNVDVTLYVDGVHGDTNATFLVGDVDPESRRLVEVTRECLERGIAAVGPGVRVRDVGRAIAPHAEAAGFSVVRQFVGHGIGTEFHAEPTVYHYDEPRATARVEPGMTFTVEPMINAGGWRAKMWDDGWTAVTADGSRSAQFEHTLLVTDDGVEVLTLP